MEQAKTEQATPTNLFGEFTKMIEQFKLPGIDVGSIIEARRKDIEALAAANRTALEGIQSLGHKQAEILRTTMDELQSLVKRVTASGSVPTASTSEVVQQAVAKAFANMRELAEAAHKSQSDTFTVISQRVQENMQELKTLLKPKQQ